MKTTFFYLKAMFAACLTLAIFAACSDDDDKSSLSSKIELSSNESEAVLALSLIHISEPTRPY